MQPTHWPLCSLTSSLPQIFPAVLPQSTHSKFNARLFSSPPRTVLPPLLPVHFPRATIHPSLPDFQALILPLYLPLRNLSYAPFLLILVNVHGLSLSVLPCIYPQTPRPSPGTSHSWLYPKPDPLPPSCSIPSWEM